MGRLEQSPDAAGEVALEAADGFAGALALAASFGDVVAGRLVTARAGHDHAVQGRVDLAVAALVEAVALRGARAGGGGGDPPPADEPGPLCGAPCARGLAAEVGGGPRARTPAPAPAARAARRASELGRCREALCAGDLADELGGDQRPEPRLVQQLRRELLRELGDLALEPVDGERELAQAAQLVARDPDAHRLLGAREPPADPRAPLLREQRAARQPQLGPQIVQMPQQRAVELDAMANRRSRWSTSSRRSSSGPSRCAAGKDSRPSCSAARATLSASIASDLPRRRARWRAFALRCVGIRSTRSPRSIRNR